MPTSALRTPAAGGTRTVTVHVAGGGAAVIVVRARSETVLWLRRAAIVVAVICAAVLEASIHWRLSTPAGIAVAVLAVRAAMRPTRIELRIEGRFVCARTRFAGLFEGDAWRCTPCTIPGVSGTDHGIALHTSAGEQIIAIGDASEATVRAAAERIDALLNRT